MTKTCKPWKKVCMHLLVPGYRNYRVMNDARALVAVGYDVTIIDVIGDSSRPCTEEIEGIHFQHVLAPNWFAPTRVKLWFLVKALILIIRCTWRLFHFNADIYHAHVEHAFLAAYLAARLRKKGLIFDTPELTMFGPNILRWPLLRFIAIACIRQMSWYCDSYITGSPQYKPVLADLYGHDQILVLRHIPPYRVVTKNNRLQQKLGLPFNVRVVLYQGYIQADRGLDLLVQAAAYLNPDVVIVLMGDSYGNTASELIRFIGDAHVQDRIMLLPAVPYAELLDWTASADIGLTILPPDYSLSIRLCLPNKFFEYIMAGVPVLSSNLIAIAEMIQHHQIGHILSELTPAHVGQAINAMLADVEGLARMRNNARLAVEQGLRWENECVQLVELYQAICLKHTEYVTIVSN